MSFCILKTLNFNFLFSLHVCFACCLFRMCVMKPWYVCCASALCLGNPQAHDSKLSADWLKSDTPLFSHVALANVAKTSSQTPAQHHGIRDDAKMLVYFVLFLICSKCFLYTCVKVFLNLFYFCILFNCTSYHHSYLYRGVAKTESTEDPAHKFCLVVEISYKN